MTVLQAAILLFLVMDAFGNIPLFVTALKDVPQDRKQKIIVRELVFALVVLIVFLFFGRFILEMLRIDEPSLGIAGGIILFLIAIKMIFPLPGGVFGSQMQGGPFLVPLAIPLIAGPSSMTTVLLLATREPTRILEWLLALVLAWLLSALILVLSGRLSILLGERVLTAIERLMGMVLTTIAVQMFLTGVRSFLAQ